jgi:TIR domain-containing protein/pentapeptide repeat protein
MASEEALKRIQEGSDAWNAWRHDRREALDLGGVNLSGTELSGVDLSGAKLSEADLTGSVLSRAKLKRADLRLAKLTGADLSGAILHNANLFNANLSKANLIGADLSAANLTRADLTEAAVSDALLKDTNLSSANLTGADVRGALLYETVLANIDLTGVNGLESCRHSGPSFIDLTTLQKSNPLPLAFLQGVGLPDSAIGYICTILSQPVQYYSCFISYSHKDQEFVQRLHADLQSKGVRCWFAPHDLPIGGKILDEIDAAIRLREKLLLVLSEHSIKSDWVEDEVTTAFEEERKRGQIVLFPVRLDDIVMETREGWAAKLRAGRHIGDFRHWKAHDIYQKTLERVLRDLEADRKLT